MREQMYRAVPADSIFVVAKERYGRSHMNRLKELGFNPTQVFPNERTRIPKRARVVVVVPRAASHRATDVCNDWWRSDKEAHTLVRSVGAASLVEELAEHGAIVPGSRVPPPQLFRCWTEWVEGALDAWPDATSRDIASAAESFGLVSDTKRINRQVARRRRAQGLGGLPRGGSSTTYPANYVGPRVTRVPVEPMPMPRGVMAWDRMTVLLSDATERVADIRARLNGSVTPEAHKLGMAPPSEPEPAQEPEKALPELDAAKVVDEAVGKMKSRPLPLPPEPQVILKPQPKPRVKRDESSMDYLKDEVGLVLAWMREWQIDALSIESKTGKVRLSSRPKKREPVSDEPVFEIG